MSPLPLPIRIAAGLAAIALERARKLPQDVTEWPMTAVSSALQVSMRVQQRITELAIKGDEALASLREAEEDPPWAVFDEDLPAPTHLRPEGRNGFDEADVETGAESWLEGLDEVYDHGPAPTEAADLEATQPQAVEPEAIQPVDGSTETPNSPTSNAGHAGEGGPGVLPVYPELTLASVRGRLRVFSVAELEELLAYERGHQDRPDFVRMLTNRIATVRGQ